MPVTLDGSSDDAISTTWMANVGMRALVYVRGPSRATRAVKEGQVLTSYGVVFRRVDCLRPLHCRNPKDNYRAKCAIKLSREKVTDWTMFRTEWGWRESDHPLADPDQRTQPRWYGYRITHVRAFEPILVTFTKQGIPWQIPVCAEQQKLVSAIRFGRHVVVDGVRCQEIRTVAMRAREQLREQARETRAASRLQMTVFEKKGINRCCKRSCSAQYAVVPRDPSGVNLISWIRSQFHGWSEQTRRVFMQARMTQPAHSMPISTCIWSLPMCSSNTLKRNVYPCRRLGAQRAWCAFAELSGCGS